MNSKFGILIQKGKKTFSEKFFNEYKTANEEYLKDCQDCKDSEVSLWENSLPAGSYYTNWNIIKKNF